MDRNSREHKLLAIWAADCAERVLPLFEQVQPKDDRPRKAIEKCRTWARTGVFKMADIRTASLGAHAAAREVKEFEAACFSAHAAGQAVATAHVPQHAYGGAYYALKAIAASDPENAERRTTHERKWQSRHLPTNLRTEIMKRILIQRRGAKIFIKILKGEGFY